MDFHPFEQRAERVLVRRRRLVSGSRYLVLDPRAIESVLPRAQVFLVPAVARGSQPAPHAAATELLGRVATFIGAAVRSLGQASRPVLAALDRRLAAAVGLALRLSRRGVTAVAEAAIGMARLVRREAPRVAALLSARARETARVTVTALHLLGAFLRCVARLLADLIVLAAVLVVAAWRTAAAARASQPRALGKQRRSTPPDARELRDANAPLARDASIRTSTTSTPRSRR